MLKCIKEVIVLKRVTVDNVANNAALSAEWLSEVK